MTGSTSPGDPRSFHFPPQGIAGLLRCRSAQLLAQAEEVEARLEAGDFADAEATVVLDALVAEQTWLRQVLAGETDRLRRQVRTAGYTSSQSGHGPDTRSQS